MSKADAIKHATNQLREAQKELKDFDQCVAKHNLKIRERRYPGPECDVTASRRQDLVDVIEEWSKMLRYAEEDYYSNAERRAAPRAGAPNGSRPLLLNRARELPKLVCRRGHLVAGRIYRGLALLEQIAGQVHAQPRSAQFLQCIVHQRQCGAILTLNHDSTPG